MMNKKIIEKIKSRGYWRINFEPLVYKDKIESLTKIKRLISDNSVKLRGWDYPHIPRENSNNNQTISLGNNYCEGWVDWSSFIELWRMYQSGQFIHYIALRDDWTELYGLGTPNKLKIEPGSIINITGEITYEITEIFEFLSRLTRSGIYDEGVKVSISLNNTEGRKLAVLDPMRFPLMWDYKTNAKTLDFKKKYTKEELLVKPKDLAFDVIMWIFDRFNWETPSIDVIKKDQNDLYKIYE